MPVFFIPPHAIQSRIVTITGSLLTHIRDSLRTRTGDELWVGDGQRLRYRIRISHVTRDELQGHILEQHTAPASANASVTLGQAMLKGDRMDWVIQKATELGCTAIVPLISARVITRPRAERMKPQQERWRRIALEAAQQAERWDTPEISSYHQALDFFRTSPSGATRLMLSERDTGASLQTIALPMSNNHTIVLTVGPEGGWEQEERRRAAEAGFLPVTLGPRILRAETAAIAAISILLSRLGALG